MNFSASLKTLRHITHELRQSSPQGSLKDSLVLRYIFDQYHKFKTTEQQVCKAQEEVNFIANSYLCYLRSTRKRQEIHDQYHGRGERSVEETARLVGFKLPHDPK
ncbi:hypothetical protein ILUMI_12866 [Ignelater luminosus]|uniref:Protein FMC1 homolog n=1 Tax=Ignelater luminosus TaxID=2038154 RepID=A0A8K0G6D5_IGNLU|nr:hypothetical protein ILUMI_12866 [Ignelater luminosus]